MGSDTDCKWLLNWAIAYATPYLVNYGPGYANLQSKIFFIWFACCFFCIAFVYFFIYETKGLSLEEIDEMYNTVSAARKSPGWEPSVTFQQRAMSGNIVHVAAAQGDVMIPDPKRSGSSRPPSDQSNEKSVSGVGRPRHEEQV